MAFLSELFPSGHAVLSYLSQDGFIKLIEFSMGRFPSPVEIYQLIEMKIERD